MQKHSYNNIFFFISEKRIERIKGKKLENEAIKSKEK